MKKMLLLFAVLVAVAVAQRPTPTIQAPPVKNCDEGHPCIYPGICNFGHCILPP